ncbi:MAG: 16S rRNA (cytosine(1402)-N(4))-methyltransferase RsmH [Chloroflexi bacterium]|nr:16S rRNA (cytosine(1402)-N(4))-methyltransferase RsmH [Chloroflexota bacterium]
MSKELNDSHIPVLYDEVLALLQPQANGRYIDGTLGAGGHTAGILVASAPTGRVLAFDRDPEAIRFAQARLTEFGDRVTYVNSSYSEMGTQAPTHGFALCDGILLDLGLSSRQLHNGARGFSFMKEGPLDMRFDPRSGKTAADLVNNLSESALTDIFWRYGEVRNSRQVARAIVDKRPFHTTTQLANVIAQVRRKRSRIHPATLVFQALRIAVNKELEIVEAGVLAAIDLLKPGGRLAVISFHSLEDRFVKQTFRQLSRTYEDAPELPMGKRPLQPTLHLITRKPVKATDAEIARNTRSRSARLRVAAKIETD